jgi:uncharacterized protein (TIGR04222 family)
VTPVVAGALLLVALVLWFAPVKRRGRADTSPALAGMLAGGTKRALRATLVTMWLRGEIQVAKVGVLERADGLSETEDPLERTVYQVLAYPVGPAAIRSHLRTAETFGTMRRHLIAAGLLLPRARWWLIRLCSLGALGLCVAGFVSGDLVVSGVLTVVAVASLRLPRRTVAGARLIRELRRTYPAPDEDAELEPAATGMVVATRGTLDLPGLAGFAHRGGLISGGDSNSPADQDPMLHRPSVPLTADPNRRP